jgi:hypothetical protein
MCETRSQVGAAEGRQGFRIGAPPVIWSMTAAARPQKVSNFEAVLLAIAGHDFRQPLQVFRVLTNASDMEFERARSCAACGPGKLRSTGSRSNWSSS